MSEVLAQLEKKGGGNKSTPFIVVPVRDANNGKSSSDCFVVSSSLEYTALSYGASITDTINTIKQSEFVQNAVTRSSGYTYYYLDITVSKNGAYMVNGVTNNYNAGDVISSLVSNHAHLIMYLG